MWNLGQSLSLSGAELDAAIEDGIADDTTDGPFEVAEDTYVEVVPTLISTDENDSDDELPEEVCLLRTSTTIICL